MQVLISFGGYRIQVRQGMRRMICSCWGRVIKTHLIESANSDAVEVLSAGFSFKVVCDRDLAAGESVVSRQEIYSRDCAASRDYSHTASSDWRKDLDRAELAKASPG